MDRAYFARRECQARTGVVDIAYQCVGVRAPVLRGSAGALRRVRLYLPVERAWLDDNAHQDHAILLHQPGDDGSSRGLAVRVLSGDPSDTRAPHADVHR